MPMGHMPKMCWSCRIPLQVSWIRYKDTSLLTVGRYTYTTDLRFEAFHSPHTDDWIVRLKNPRSSDSGVYGCQISTTPHRTQLVYLTVHGKTTAFWPFLALLHASLTISNWLMMLLGASLFFSFLSACKRESKKGQTRPHLALKA